MVLFRLKYTFVAPTTNLSFVFMMTTEKRGIYLKAFCVQVLALFEE
jgi:hypothetical protein